MTAPREKGAGRVEFALTAAEFASLNEACRPRSATMQIDLSAGQTVIERDDRQARANAWWKAHGEANGYDGATVRFVSGQDGLTPLRFTAEVRP